MIFLTGPLLNLLSVGREVTDFKKTLESQTGPPNDRKKSKCLVILIRRKFRGGPVEGFMGGGQSRDIFRGGPVKKDHPVCIV